MQNFICRPTGLKEQYPVLLLVKLSFKSPRGTVSFTDLMVTCRLKGNTYQVPLQATPGTGSETFRAELSWVQPRGAPGTSWGAPPAPKCAPGALGPGTVVPPRSAKIFPARHTCVNKERKQTSRKARRRRGASCLGAGSRSRLPGLQPRPASRAPNPQSHLRPESAPAGSPPSDFPRTPARTPRTAGRVAARRDTPGPGTSGTPSPRCFAPARPCDLGPSAHAR